MKYFEVVNWKKFQHYKHRNPPWIKLHIEVLDNIEFEELTEIQRYYLVSIWLLASRNDNKTPYSSKWLASRLHSASIKLADLEALESLGFIRVYEDASEPLAPRLQSARPETETETEKRESRDICPEPKADSGPEYELSFPVRDKDVSERRVSLAKVTEWKDTYIGVDVDAELRRARQWCLDNPTKQKTVKGLTRYLGGWLSRCQDSPSKIQRPRGFGMDPDEKQKRLDEARRTAVEFEKADEEKRRARG